jgi:hypothetical protein
MLRRVALELHRDLALRHGFSRLVLRQRVHSRTSRGLGGVNTH